jgi:hypothetical protein
MLESVDGVMTKAQVKALVDEMSRMARQRSWHGRVGKWRWWFGFQLAEKPRC